MSQTKILTQAQKQTLKAQADKHISAIGDAIDTRVSVLKSRMQDQKGRLPELRETDLEQIQLDEHGEKAFAMYKLYKEDAEHLELIRSSPYFVRLDVTWQDTGISETIYISKYQLKDQNVFSWVSPISTLRFAELGKASYELPAGGSKHTDIQRKDNYIITGGDIVFMTYDDASYPRQVVYQKHIAAKRDFLLPEIVAELDRLQDQIIRSDPHGAFLISGPAGSGKTTLALHRIAYLVLTPEFKDFFEPERILVFVADEGAVQYFGKLLPELGINGVRITTFNDWALMICNSRFRAPSLTRRFKFLTVPKAVEYVSAHNPWPHIEPRLVVDEYRKLKQGLISRLQIKEGPQKEVYPKLHELYLNGLTGVGPKLAHGFSNYLNFQKQNLLLDEIDTLILLSSLDDPISPFAHVVVDEVQNWLPEQLQIVKTIADRRYESITYIGDIRQKTRAFSINSWQEIGENFDAESPQKVELLKVYRNTKQILDYLQTKGYDITIQEGAKGGVEVKEIQIGTGQSRDDTVRDTIRHTQQKQGMVQIGILAKYQHSLEGLEYLGYHDGTIHMLTIEEAQGLEFHTVIILDAQDLDMDKDQLVKQLGFISATEYLAQARHLFYVAATRAQHQLVVVRT